jgi:hypothetical protein
MAILISGTLQGKVITRNKDGKMPTYQEDTAALNEYVTNYRDSNV